MRWIAAALLVAAMGSRAVLAQAASSPASAPATAPSEPAPQQRVVHMTVRATGEPVPALKYQLLTPVPEQIHGDAMTLYYLIMERVARIRENHKDFEDKANVWWRDASAADLPKEEVRSVLKEFDEIWPLLDLATRQTTCQWNLQVEKLGFAAELPSLTLWRYLGRFTAVRAKLAIAEGRYDNAIGSLRMGYALARHVAEGPTVIQALVGIAIASMQTRQLEAFIAADASPNLYWAIATLPKPFIDLRTGLQFETSVVYYTFPELREARSGTLTPQQWKTLASQIAKQMQTILAGQEQVPNFLKGGFPSTVLPDAREYWHSRGLSDKQIDAMPVNQANIVYSLDIHDQLYAETVKWFSLPYWQARPGLYQANKRIEEASKSGKAGLFIWFLHASLGKIYTQQAVLQQDLAALQTIEAIRIYAARYSGRLPVDFMEMDNPPAPITPVTGKTIVYSVKANTFELNAPAPQGYDVSRGVRYIVTVTK